MSTVARQNRKGSSVRGGGPPSGSLFIFDPEDTGTLWQDKPPTVPADADGDLIWTTNNSNGDANNLYAGSTTNRPTLKTDIMGTNNIARFSANKNMAADPALHAAWNGMVAGADKQFFVAAAVKNVGTVADKWLAGAYQTTGNQRQVVFYATGGKLRVLMYFEPDGSNALAWITTNVVFDATSDFVPCFAYDGTLDTNSGEDRATLMVNGVAQSLDFTAPTSLDSMSAVTARLSVGSLSSPTGLPFLTSDTDLAYVAAYPGLDKVTAVNDYLTDRFGV